jgi:signal peptidase II
MQPGDSRYVAPFFNWVLTFNPAPRSASSPMPAAGSAGSSPRWRWRLGWIVSLLPRHSGEFRLSLALTLILGGALGNVIDRLRFGAVVDFVQWHAAGFYWPAFNIADAAISVGAVLMIIDQLFGTHNSDATPGQATRSHRGERH